MAQVLEEASQSYDIVIVDGPPVMGLADAPVLSAIADATVFVVEAERGRSGQLKVTRSSYRRYNRSCWGRTSADVTRRKAPIRGISALTTNIFLKGKHP